MKQHTCLILLVLLVLPATGGWGETYPDDWYFSSNRGGAGLRVLEGLEAPELQTAAWEGSATTLKDARGKVVVLDFWATWCGPCVASIPKNIELVKTANDQDLVFIGIHSANGGWDKAPAMMRDKGINYPVALDAEGATSKAYKVRAIPTYVVIDRRGVIRAAGLLPARVKEVVQQLVEEAGPQTATVSAGEFDDAWFYGGPDRPSSWREQAGRPAKPVRIAEWADTPPEAGDGRVQVLQFTRPELGLARQHLASLAELAKTYAVQGVQFSAICDAKADWAQMKSKAGEWAPGIPVGRDRPVLMNLLSDDHYAEAGARTDGLTEGGPGGAFEDPFAKPNQGSVRTAVGLRSVIISTVQGGTVVTSSSGKSPATQSPPPSSAGRAPGNTAQPGGKTAAREAGMTAKAYGIRIAPVTVVIDRAGQIRATGLKLAHLKDVLDKLLSESTPEPPSET